MKSSFKEIHVLSTFIINLILLVLAISTNNFIISIAVLFYCVYIFYLTNSLKRIKRGFLFFLPVFLITILVNMIFLQGGTKVLFHIGSKSFTLEGLFYAFILAFKLLIVIYIFECISLMLDSDRAVSYFSSVMPKSTLIFMISIKLFPSMKGRIDTLREIYSIRGIEYEGNKTMEKLRSYIPVMSILLEDSLEKSFDIGEAAYVRGFLSKKRTVYERQHVKIYDFLLIGIGLSIMAAYIVYYSLGYDSLVSGVYKLNEIAMNKPFIILGLLFLLLYAAVSPLGRRLVQRNELYQH